MAYTDYGQMMRSLSSDMDQALSPLDLAKRSYSVMSEPDEEKRRQMLLAAQQQPQQQQQLDPAIEAYKGGARGLNELRAGIGESRALNDVATSQNMAQQDALAADQAKMIAQQGEIESQAFEHGARMAEEQSAAQAGYIQKTEEINNRKRQYTQQFQAEMKDINDAMDFRGSPEERKELLRMAQDENIDPGTRKKAQKELQQRTGVDQGNALRGKNGIIAALSLVLGAVGAAVQGKSDNPAIGILMNSIDRDIQLQRDQLSANRGRSERATNVYNIAMRKFGDEVLSAELARDKLLSAVEGKITAQTQRLRGAEARNKAAQTVAMIQQERLKSQDIISQRMNLLSEQRAVSDMQMIGMGQQMIASRMAAAGDGAGSGLANDLAARGIVLKEGVQMDAGEKKNMLETVKTARSFNSGLDALIDLTEKEGQSFSPGWTTEYEAKSRGMAKDLQLKLKDIAKLGVLAGPDMELLESLVPSDPTAFNQTKVMAKLKTLRDRFRSQLSSDLKTAGVHVPDLADIDKEIPEGSI